MTRSTNAAAGTSYDPLATGVYALLHLGCIGAIFVGVSVQSFVVFAAAFVLRSVAVSVVYHRYFAHRSYRTSRAMQFAMGLYGALTVMGSVLWWADTHRRHHRDADTPTDLHSPSYQGIGYAHWGWFLDRRHRAVQLDNVRDLTRYPELVWLDRWDPLLKGIYIAACVAAFGWTGLVWAFFVPTVVVLHMIHWIQSVSHGIGGYRRYPTADNSRNHWLFGVLSLGEGYHHNHHCFPWSARLGMRPWELDLGHLLLRGLASVGLVWDVREPSRKARGGTDPALARQVARASNELRATINAALEVLESVERRSGSARESIAALRRRATDDLEALLGRVEPLLIAGPSALCSALERHRDAMRKDTSDALGDDPVRVAALQRFDAVFRDRWPAVVYRGWHPAGGRPWPVARNVARGNDGRAEVV